MQVSCLMKDRFNGTKALSQKDQFHGNGEDMACILLFQKVVA